MTKDNKDPYEDDVLDDDFEVDPGLQESYSEQSNAQSKKTLMIVIGIILVAGYFIYNSFFGSNEKKVEPVEVSPKIATVKPPEKEPTIVKPVTSLPEPPPLVAPETPAPPPPQPVIPVAPAPAPELPKFQPAPVVQPQAPALTVTPFTSKADMEEAKSKLDRRKSGIIISGGKGDTAEEKDKDGNKKKKVDEYIDDGDVYFEPKKTSFEQAMATKIASNMAFVVAQGKVIDAILETAINSDVAGDIRAIVSHDIYGEAGNVKLIPKGSRLIGSYTSNIALGQTRIQVIWHRIIRPDGIDVAIESSGIDALGRAGLTGHVDNKYAETFGNALLLSAINVAAAIATDKITNTTPSNAPTTTTTQSTVAGATSTTTTSSSTATQTAAQQVPRDLGEAAKKITENSLKANPTITVYQGTAIKVFVKRDLIFPANLVGGAKSIR